MKSNNLSHLKTGFIYYTCTTLFLTVIFLQYIDGGSLDFNGWAYFLTGSLSQAAIFSLIPFLLSLPLLFVGKKKTLYATALILLSTVLLVFFIMNGMIYSIYRFHINGFVIDMLFGGAAGDIFQFDTMLYIKVGVGIISLLAFTIALWFLCRWIIKKTKYAAATPIIATIIIATIFSHLLHAYSAAVKLPSVMRSAAVLPYNAPLTANRLMVRLGVISKESVSVNLAQGKGSGLNYPLNPITTQPCYTKKNIVFLVIDSWNPRAWSPETQPNLYEFSKRCSKFNNHLSSSNGTTGSILGMFFGLPASYKDELDISGTQPLLTTHLLDQGYDVKVFASASLVHPPFARMLFSGVENLRIESPGNTVYEKDSSITKEFCDYIDKRDEKPFFAFLFYDLAHSFELTKEQNRPFAPAWDYPDYLSLNNGTDPLPFWNLYRNTLYNIDLMIGGVISSLEKQGLLDNTIIIITGDHGQEFNENKKNYWGHNGNFSPAQIRVPFFLFDAEKAVESYNHRTTHYDISTTLLKEYLGVQNPEEDLGVGHLLSDSCNRDWHFVGDYNNYGYIIDDKLNLLEKKNAGYIEISDSLVNPLNNFKYDIQEFNRRILQMNRFYKK